MVTAPIIGPRTMEQLTGSLRALEITLDEATLTACDEVWATLRGDHFRYNR